MRGYVQTFGLYCNNTNIFSFSFALFCMERCRKPHQTQIQTRDPDRKRRRWTATRRMRSPGRLCLAQNPSLDQSLTRILTHLLGRAPSPARKVQLHFCSVFFKESLLSLIYFDPFPHRKTGTKASCAEAQTRPGQTNGFIVLRQRQVRLTLCFTFINSPKSLEPFFIFMW